MGCYNDDVLFVHIPKTGGWSVKSYLVANLPGMLTPDNPESKLPIGHVRLADIEHYTGRSPDSFRKILAVIRDPYAQQVSQACFWATRFMEQASHVHDIATSRHLQMVRIIQDLIRCGLKGQRFVWGPEHLDTTGFVADPSCDFHVWYKQHKQYPPEPAVDGVNHYDDFGGFFRYWLDVDGVIPDNVSVIRQEELGQQLPSIVREATGKENLPEVPRLNGSSHADPSTFYSPSSASLVEQKFAWAFQHHYEKMQWN